MKSADVHRTKPNARQSERDERKKGFSVQRQKRALLIHSARE